MKNLTMQERLTADLLALADEHCRVSGLKHSTLSLRAHGKADFFERIRRPATTGDGVRESFTVRKYDEVVAWFASNWLPEARWPEGVARPK